MGTVFTSKYRAREQYSPEMFGGTLSTEGEHYSLVNTVRGEQYSLGKPYSLLHRICRVLRWPVSAMHKSFSHFDFGASHSLACALAIPDFNFKPFLHFYFGSSHSSILPQVIPQFRLKLFLDFVPSHSSILLQVILKLWFKTFFDYRPKSHRPHTRQRMRSM